MLSIYRKKEESLQATVRDVLNSALVSAGRSPYHPRSRAHRRCTYGKGLRFCKASVVANSAPVSDALLLVSCMQGPKDAWIGLLEFKRTQGDAELQLARYFQEYLRIRVENRARAVCTSLVPCVALEVVGNELR